MGNINLIFTQHKSLGRCNSEELLALVEAIKPEVIFEELSHQQYEECYKHDTLVTLETRAIKNYLRNNKILHIPIDTYGLPIDYHNEVDKLLETILDTNLTHDSILLNSLINDKDFMVAKHGFSFLNSKQNELFFREFNVLKGRILATLNDEDLFRIDALHDYVIAKREREMIENIYHYTHNNQYKIALMFIGSAHMKTFQEAIEYERTVRKTISKWTVHID